MNKDEFDALYPLDPRGTVEAQLNKYVELGALTRRWNPGSGCWGCTGLRTAKPWTRFWPSWPRRGDETLVVHDPRLSICQGGRSIAVQPARVLCLVHPAGSVIGRESQAQGACRRMGSG